MAIKLKRPKWMPRWANAPLFICLGFMAWLLFFGDSNYMRTLEYNGQINELKAQIKIYEDSTARYEKMINDLNTDNETLERLVREKYGMKRTNEEVFITDIP